MENRRKLVGDLERYDALLRLTTDHQAITAIEQLIRETRDRLNELDRADDLNRDHERSGAVVHENKVRPAALGNRAVQPKRRGRINSMGQLDFLFKARSC